MNLDSDQALHVEFSRRSMEIPFKSQEAGRPIFEDVDFIRICVPGSQLTVIERPVDDFDKQRFPLHWHAYANAQNEDGAVGTPMRQWPMLSPAIREELHAMKFRTVEQLASATDQQLGDIGMVAGMAGQALRAKAKAYLEAASGAAAVEKYNNELEAMRAEIEALKAEKRGPGRPRKETVSDAA
jgi:hypothetical protein